MLMSLGLFVFERASLPHQELQRSSSWRHASMDRFGRRAASQYAGPGDDDITLTGALLPGVAGSMDSIEALRAMADEGGVHQLMDIEGRVLGHFSIERLDERQSLFMMNGVPRKADFTVNLKRRDG